VELLVVMGRFTSQRAFYSAGEERLWIRLAPRRDGSGHTLAARTDSTTGVWRLWWCIKLAYVWDERIVVALACSRPAARSTKKIAGSVDRGGVRGGIGAAY
jgi:hypothetical protein